MKYSLDSSNFFEEISSLSHSIAFLYLHFFHLRRLSNLSLLFSGTLPSVMYIFPFLPCLSLLFFHLGVCKTSSDRKQLIQLALYHRDMSVKHLGTRVLSRNQVIKNTDSFMCIRLISSLCSNLLSSFLHSNSLF